MPAARPLIVAGLRLVAPVGRGAEGEVWDARDGRGRRRALKLIRPDALVDPAEVQRRGSWLVEVEHPALVRVWRTGVLRGGGLDGWGFVEMSFVDGRSLHQVPALDGALELLEPLAEGLDLLHAGAWSEGRPLVHRDVKPANLIESRDGGLVLVDHSTLRTAAADTVTRIGTPVFAAPEVMSGRIGPPADVYSFCATAVALRTGARGEALAELLAEPESLDLPAGIRAGLRERPGERPWCCRAALEVEGFVAAGPAPAWLPAVEGWGAGVSPTEVLPAGGVGGPAAGTEALPSAGQAGATEALPAAGVVGGPAGETEALPAPVVGGGPAGETEALPAAGVGGGQAEETDPLPLVLADSEPPVLRYEAARATEALPLPGPPAGAPPVPPPPREHTQEFELPGEPAALRDAPAAGTDLAPPPVPRAARPYPRPVTGWFAVLAVLVATPAALVWVELPLLPEAAAVLGVVAFVHLACHGARGRHVGAALLAPPLAWARLFAELLAPPGRRRDWALALLLGALAVVTGAVLLAGRVLAGRLELQAAARVLAEVPGGDLAAVWVLLAGAAALVLLALSLGTARAGGLGLRLLLAPVWALGALLLLAGGALVLVPALLTGRAPAVLRLLGRTLAGTVALLRPERRARPAPGPGAAGDSPPPAGLA